MFSLGIATYDDYDGLYFTIQSIRMYHPLVTEIIIIDNNPDSKFGKCNKTLQTESTPSCIIKYVPYIEKKSTTIKGEAFKHATNEYVIICDSHILFPLNLFVTISLRVSQILSWVLLRFVGVVHQLMFVLTNILYL